MAGLNADTLAFAPAQFKVSEVAPVAPQLTVKFEPTVCDAGVTEKLGMLGGAPHVVPFQACPLGHTQAEPFHAWPPVQVVVGGVTAQVVPFHVVPEGHDAVPESDAVSLPHGLLAVAVQFVTPALRAASAPVPPELGLSV